MFYVHLFGLWVVVCHWLFELVLSVLLPQLLQDKVQDVTVVFCIFNTFDIKLRIEQKFTKL